MLGKDVKVDSSTRIRQKMITEGIKYFKEHPLTGVGIGNSGEITGLFTSRTYLHNNFVDLLVYIIN